jgi:hypothetical protein
MITIVIVIVIGARARARLITDHKFRAAMAASQPRSNARSST